MIITNTPIVQYQINNRIIHVKREDLCVRGPAFSKLRGVAEHLLKRSEGTIGVLDSFYSKAGWGTAMLCREIGKKCVVFYPVYKDDMGLRTSQYHAAQEHAVLFGLKAGRSCIIYHEAKNKLLDEYPDSYMMPNALKCEETVGATAREVLFTPAHLLGSDTLWVISVSSGTMAAGVVQGLTLMGSQSRVLLHMGYSRPERALIRYVTGYAPGYKVKIDTVDEGYSYKDACDISAPFPCNSHYDRKAWSWLTKAVNFIPEPNVVFWNIGA